MMSCASAFSPSRELVTTAGEINVDFADVQAIMRDAGPAWMSIGWGVGQDRAKNAAQQAITNPLLDVSIEGARGVLFNITGAATSSSRSCTTPPRSSSGSWTRTPISSSEWSPT